jgi:hypothetical protein
MEWGVVLRRNASSIISFMKGDLAFNYALWRIGKLPPERVPDVSCDALEQGFDHPTLGYLAGLSKPSSVDIGTSFDDVCHELGVVPTAPCDVEATEFGMWLEKAIPIAGMIAKQILDGAIDPAEGWLNIPWRDDRSLGPLDVFFTFADREGGNISFDDNFRRRLNAACRQFLAGLEPEITR